MNVRVKPLLFWAFMSEPFVPQDKLKLRAFWKTVRDMPYLLERPRESAPRNPRKRCPHTTEG